MAYHVVSTHPMALNDLETFVAFPQAFFRLGVVILPPLGFVGLRCHPQKNAKKEKSCRFPVVSGKMANLYSLIRGNCNGANNSLVRPLPSLN